MFKSTILVSLLVVSAMAERPHRGPKVGGPQTHKHSTGTYVPRPITDDQQVKYQPQPIQYVQQPVGAAQQQHQPIQYQQQQPIQYQQQQPIQYQPQQPIQYVQPQQQVQYQQPEPVKYTPIIDHGIEEGDVRGDDQEEDFVAEVAAEVVPSFKSAQPSYQSNDNLVNSVLRSAPSNSYLINARAGDKSILTDRLISNYTTIRADNLIVNTFNCDKKQYGYYADVDNDCEIFHICLPVHLLPYPALKKGEAPPPTVTYTFSFICPKWTIFAQDTLTCAWATEAIPCARAAELTDVINSRFFKDVKKTSAL